VAIYPDKKDGNLTGRFRVEVQVGGLRKRGRFDTFAEAKIKEKEYEKRLREGTNIEATIRDDGKPKVLSTLVRRAAPILWNGSEHGVVSVTRINKLIGWLGDPRLDDLQDFVDRALLKLRAKDKAEATINRYYAALHRVIRWGAAPSRKLVPIMPEFEWQDEDEGRVRWLTPDEERRGVALLRVFEFDEVADFVVAALDTGCRRSELLQAEAGQLDGVWLRLWETKNGSARSVPLTDRTRAILEARLPWQITEGRLRYAWDKMKAAMGLSDEGDFVLHACRHTRATRLVELGVNLAVIQRWMGHTDIKTTMRYAHVSDDALMAALDKVQLENIHLSQRVGASPRGNIVPHSEIELAASAAKPLIKRGKAEAGVAELVDALDLGSSDENRGGSNPSARTSL
jgi:integrase